METKVIRITSAPLSEQLVLPGQIIASGGLVVFPTETVYGLGGNALNPASSKKIYAAKGRPSDNPLIVHVARPEDAEELAFTVPSFYELAQAFMPGPLTVILKKKDIVPSETSGGLDTVAIRCPANPVAHALIECAGVPIAAPSANLSGKPSPTSAQDVLEDMSGRVDCIIDGGPSDIGLESTIVSLAGDVPVLLRPGGITYDALLCVLPGLEIAHAVTHEIGIHEKALSPGMKYRHYAPSKPLILLKGPEEKILSFLKQKQLSEKCAILCYSEELSQLNGERLYDIGRGSDLETQAHRLFSSIRMADRSDAAVIYAHLPILDGLGLALYNRLIRAAAHTVIEL
ncbi:MAG: threonylcarbamoyl-AMP synthase [Clostridia bacterium]|nr:threonylcarbamoyl-AMP synthase [Clostridia bacterium]